MAQPYNKQWDEEIYRQVNDYNKEALDDWLLELQVQGKTEKTIYQYTRNVKLFFIWIYKYRKNCRNNFTAQNTCNCKRRI